MCGKEPNFDYSFILEVLCKILILYFVVKLTKCRTNNWKQAKFKRRVFLMTLVTLLFLVGGYHFKIIQKPLNILMLFNSFIGLIFLFDCQTVRSAKLRWLIKIGASSLIVYFWWITNSWILLDILVIGLLFLLCETLWLYSLKHALLLLLVMCCFECGWKLWSTGSMIGPTIFDVMSKDMRF